MKKVSLLLLFIALILPTSASAYYEYTTGGNLTAQVSPRLATPGQTVTISLTSYDANLDGATIVWAVDGKNISQGIGRQTFSFPMPKLGQSQTVTAEVTTLSGQKIIKTFGFQGNYVDLFWQADTVSPPFYRGHSQASRGSAVTIVAVPQVYDSRNQLLAEAALLYAWEVNGIKAGRGVGTSYQSITLPASSFDGNRTIKVTVSTVGGDVKASNSLFIGVRTPQIILYPVLPLLGTIYQRAFTGTATLTEKTLSVESVPYFLPRASGPLTYRFKVESKDAGADPANPAIATFQRGSTAGTFTVQAEIASGTSSPALATTFLRLITR